MQRCRVSVGTGIESALYWVENLAPTPLLAALRARRGPFRDPPRGLSEFQPKLRKMNIRVKSVVKLKWERRFGAGKKTATNAEPERDFRLRFASVFVFAFA